ncbi:hypothetical protein EDEG_03725 [Edhazardia aedis USNM 41457]|uniref:Kinesin-like protein n=1 Tax=Edhazardia aedis (strain USNM 41457) TaxID=1003232 RepID=J8ZPY8_EDHAE|nr:hypothetical protein EDEG_03725 [Edhazardia aedis USNM 41457]|eukprot:EJW01758.1 hypothetical protein EDEG_03725 [Edhazardia aedis USNM 41457]
MNNIKTIIRLTPPCTLKIKENSVFVEKGGNVCEYKFDAVFPPNSTQIEIYAIFKDLLASVFKGENCTVFCYGATGSGKTYTMTGRNNSSKSVSADSKGDWKHNTDSNNNTSNNKNFNNTSIDTNNNNFTIANIDKSNAYVEGEIGIVHLLIKDLFKKLQSLKMIFKEALLTFSFFEIYNEKIIDLFTFKELQIRTTQTENYIPDLTSKIITSYTEFFEIFESLKANRKTSQTALNNSSSRSHSILQLNVHLNNFTKTVKSKINLIDLAGSEDNRKTNNKGISMVESSNINRSLFVLNKVVNSILNGDLRVPFRDSKLTRVLQDSLCGQNKTWIVACVRDNLNYRDVVNTLEFAKKSSQVVGKISVCPENDLNVVEKRLREKRFERLFQGKSVKEKNVICRSGKEKNEKDLFDNKINDIYNRGNINDINTDKNNKISNTNENKAGDIEKNYCVKDLKRAPLGEKNCNITNLKPKRKTIFENSKIDTKNTKNKVENGNNEINIDIEDNTKHKITDKSSFFIETHTKNPFNTNGSSEKPIFNNSDPSKIKRNTLYIPDSFENGFFKTSDTTPMDINKTHLSPNSRNTFAKDFLKSAICLFQSGNITKAISNLKLCLMVRDDEVIEKMLSYLEMEQNKSGCVKNDFNAFFSDLERNEFSKKDIEYIKLLDKQCRFKKELNGYTNCRNNAIDENVTNKENIDLIDKNTNTNANTNTKSKDNNIAANDIVKSVFNCKYSEDSKNQEKNNLKLRRNTIITEKNTKNKFFNEYFQDSSSISTHKNNILSLKSFKKQSSNKKEKKNKADYRDIFYEDLKDDSLQTHTKNTPHKNNKNIIESNTSNKTYITDTTISKYKLNTSGINKSFTRKRKRTTIRLTLSNDSKSSKEERKFTLNEFIEMINSKDFLKIKKIKGIGDKRASKIIEYSKFNKMGLSELKVILGDTVYNKIIMSIDDM